MRTGIPDKDTAVRIANTIMRTIQSKGYAKNFTLQTIFFDDVDEIWILSYWEDKGPNWNGADCSIAIRKSNAEVLRIWFGE